MNLNMGMNMANMNNFMNNFDGMAPQQSVMPNSGGFNLPMVQSTQEDPGWEAQFFALKAYQREVGHCKVPARFKSNPKLERWVMTQRRQFTLLMQGCPSALTAERIQRLKSIGFTWSIRPEPVKTWNRKFQELKVYKNTFGNCMVPQRYQGKNIHCLTLFLLLSFLYSTQPNTFSILIFTANPQLGTWVHTQRRQYKLMIEGEGKKSSMTREKAQTLDSIGFSWAAKPSSSSRSTTSNIQQTQHAQHTQHALIYQKLNNSIGIV